MFPVDSVGYYRGRPLEAFVKYSSKSESVGIAMTLLCTEKYVDGQWCDWTLDDQKNPIEFTCPITVWVVGADGKPIEANVKRVCEVLGWDGNFDTFNDHDWAARQLQWDVVADDYNGITQFKGNWIMPYDAIPGQSGKADADKVRQIAAKYGPQLRAIASGVARPQAPSSPAPKFGVQAPADLKAGSKSTPKRPAKPRAASADPPEPPTADQIPF